MSEETPLQENASEKVKNTIERPGFHESIKGAIFDIKIYDVFRQVSTGSAASFFALFIFVIAIFNTLDLSFTVSKEFGKFARFYEANFPAIHVKDGKAAALTSDKMPITGVYDDAGEKVTIVVDTTGKTTELKGAESGVLITNDKIIRKSRTGRIVQYPMTEMFRQEITINKQAVINLQNAILTKFFPFLLLIGYVITLFLLFSQAGILSVAGLLMSRYMKLDITFLEMFNIVMYSFVPALLSVTFLNIFGFFRLLNVMIGFGASRLIFLLICYSVLMAYMSMALGMIRKKQSAVESAELTE
jgi:hypothetical protein